NLKVCPPSDLDTLKAQMRRALHTAIAAGLVVLVGGSWAPASAQLVFEAVGERALGMGGAFVAVADDATAVHWSPAGLVAGQPAGATIGWHRFGVGKADALPSPGQSRGQSSLTSLGTW